MIASDQHPIRHGHRIRGKDGQPDRVLVTHLGFSVGAATVQFAALELMFEIRADAGAATLTQRRLLSGHPSQFTPYMDDGSLDVGALGFLILEAGSSSPILGPSVDGRVAVLSGLALDDPNSYWLDRALADIDYFHFVCLSAGPNLGAVLAAYGGGAVARSVDTQGDPRAVLNVDLGGSTAKLALCHGGDVVETTALGAGTRLISFDHMGRLLETRGAAATVAQSAGVSLERGRMLSESDLGSLSEHLAEALLNVIERRSLEPLTETLMYGPPLAYPDPIDEISFTGGGAPYVFAADDGAYGDLGPALGAALRSRVERVGATLHEPDNLVRATLLGGVQYQVNPKDSSTAYSEPPAFAAARRQDAGFVPPS